MNSVQIHPNLFKVVMRKHIEMEVLKQLINHMNCMQLPCKDAGLYYSTKNHGWMLDKMPTCEGKAIQHEFRLRITRELRQVTTLTL